MKPEKAWAIVEDGRLAVFDARCPIYWRRNITKTAMIERIGFGDIARVEIRVIGKRPGRGYGSDKDDKGGYKAMTGAEKYFILKTFLIPTGDDPERDEKPKPAPMLRGTVKVETPKRDLKNPVRPKALITQADLLNLPEGAVFIEEVKLGFPPAVAVLCTYQGEELGMFKPDHVEKACRACEDKIPVKLTAKIGKKTGLPYEAEIELLATGPF